MPIIESVATDQPLSQGDLLAGIRLFTTKDGAPVPLDGDSLCLVVSRPCIAVREGHVTVASVELLAAGLPKEAITFDALLKVLIVYRDGIGMPDSFYLGNLPDKMGRFKANLDSFHDIQVPVNAAKRAAFVATHRIGRLQPEFLSDLHAKLFRAFSTMGFDDIGWFSDDDLTLLLNAGRAELYNQNVADGKKQFGAGSIPEGSRAAAANCPEAEKIKAKLQPYEDELLRRQALAPKADTAATGMASKTTTS